MKGYSPHEHRPLLGYAALTAAFNGLAAAYVVRSGLGARRPHDEEIAAMQAAAQKAIELDPKFAKAWALLAGCYAMGVAMDKAETTVNRALVLKPDLAEAHAVRGFIKMFLDWNWAEAEREFKRAIELNPNVADIHYRYGSVLGPNW